MPEVITQLRTESDLIITGNKGIVDIRTETGDLEVSTKSDTEIDYSTA